MPTLDFINQAAVKDDRWWFLACVIAGGSFSVWALRYLVRRNEEASNGRLADLKEMIRERDQIIEQQMQANERQAQTNEQLRDALKDLAAAVRELKENRAR